MYQSKFNLMFKRKKKKLGKSIIIQKSISNALIKYFYQILIFFIRQMARIPTNNPFPININPIYFQNKQTHYFPKSPSQNLPKSTTPVRFRIIQAPDNNSNTPIIMSHKPSIDQGYSPINRINKQNFQNNQFHIQPSPTKLTTKGKPGNMMDFINMGVQRPKSPINQTGQILKQTNHNYMTNQQNYLIKQGATNSNLPIKKNSVVSPTNMTLLSNRSPRKIQDQEQKKIKTQVIQDIIKNCGKQQQQNMKKSNSKNDIFNYNSNKVTQNKNLVRLDSKKTFKTLGKQSMQNPFGKDKENPNGSISLLCINDGKKAKYKVKSDQDDDQQMYCCSKCAVCLVQQGFKVVQIQKNPRDKQLNQLLGKISDLQKKISSKKEKVTKFIEINEKNYSPQLDRVDSYYNSLISMLEELRVRDRQTIIYYRNKSQKDLQNLDTELLSGIQRLNQIQSDIRPAIEQIKNKVEPQDYSRFMKRYNEDIKSIIKLLEVPQKYSEKQIHVQGQNQIQQKFDNFSEIFPQQFALRISKLSNPHQNTIQNKNNLLQNKMVQSKPMKLNLPPKSMFCQDQIQQQQQYIEEKSEPHIQQPKKPFRNLFPQESDQQMQQCQQKIQNEQQQNKKQEQKEDDQKQDQNQECCSPSFKKI